MPTLRELQKRLDSAETIRQLSGAMRSAATANYTKLCAVRDRYSPYAAALRDLMPSAEAFASGADGALLNEAGESGAAPSLCLLISGNRGLCGGYHQELFSFFAQYAQGRDLRVVPCGKKALDYCRSKKIEAEKSFSLSDVPTFNEAKEVAAYALELFSRGEVGEVTVCSRHFINMLRSEPRAATLLCRESGAEHDERSEIIFIPDKTTLSAALRPPVFTSALYDAILSAAAAAQSATLVAMRSAYENATSSISSLEISINRLRQAAVTAGVLETAIEVKE